MKLLRSNGGARLDQKEREGTVRKRGRGPSRHDRAGPCGAARDGLGRTGSDGTRNTGFGMRDEGHGMWHWAWWHGVERDGTGHEGPTGADRLCRGGTGRDRTDGAGRVGWGHGCDACLWVWILSILFLSVSVLVQSVCQRPVGATNETPSATLSVCVSFCVCVCAVCLSEASRGNQ